MEAALNTRRSRMTAPLGVILLLLLSIQGKAQTPALPPAQGQPQRQAQAPPTQLLQMLDQLNLTPEQRQKFRAINADLKDERQVANARQRLAQQSLAEAVEATNPDEKLIEQRSRELADANAALIRLRSLTEARVRQILTPDQLEKVKQIHKASLELMEQRRQENIQRQRQENIQRRTGNPQGGPVKRNNNLQPKAGPGANKLSAPKPPKGRR
jgi:Spy/CpxP family protein refolding chaperone